MKDLFAAAIFAPLQVAAPEQEPQAPKLTDHVQTESDYQEFAPPGSYDMQLQTGQTRLLILEPNNNPKNRHAGLVAHIARLSSEELARELGLETGPQIVEMTGTVKDQFILEELANFDVVNYSTGTMANNAASVIAGGLGDPNDHFQKLSRPIIVQAAGNHGHDGKRMDLGEFDRDTTDNLQFYAYSIQVGEAKMEEDGRVVLDTHSARSGPTLVAHNLTDTLTSFKYMELEVYNELSPEIQDHYHVDQAGYFSKIEGASFTAPNPSGALASAKEAYPDLSNSEHLVALVASAQIPSQKRENASFSQDTLPYEPFGWEYGLYKSERHAENLEKINDLVQELSQLKDVQTSHTEFDQAKTTYNGRPYHRHSFYIAEDFTATKLTFEAQNPLRTLPADHFIVIAPSGLSHPVPASLGTGTSRFVTEAFIGENTQGEWKILMPGESRAVTPQDDSYEILSAHFDPETQKDQHIAANFTLHGQEKGPNGYSVLSRFIEDIHEQNKPERERIPDKGANEVFIEQLQPEANQP